MRRHIVALSSDQIMPDVASELMEHKISGAPVVNEEHKRVGILNALDHVCREVRNDGLASPAQSTCRTRSNHTAPAALAECGDAERVSTHHMTLGVRSIEAARSLIGAVRLMRSARALVARVGSVAATRRNQQFAGCRGDTGRGARRVNVDGKTLLSIARPSCPNALGVTPWLSI
jgi:CBS domain-containing protein